MIDSSAIDNLIEWMVDGARPSASAKDIIDTICHTLVAAGIPVDRFALFIYTLDPNITGRRFTWTPMEGVIMSEGQIGLFSTEEYTANPLPTVVEKKISIRRKLWDPETPHDYRIVDELIADGFYRLSGATAHLHDRGNQRGKLVDEGAGRVQRRSGRCARSRQQTACQADRDIPAPPQRSDHPVGLCRAQQRRPNSKRKDTPRRWRGDRGGHPLHRSHRFHGAFGQP